MRVSVTQLPLAERQALFYTAVAGGRADLVCVLLMSGVDPNKPDPRGVPARLYSPSVPWVRAELRRLGPPFAAETLV